MGGADPAEERRTVRQADKMTDFLDDFMAKHVSRRKERSVKEYQRLIDKHIRPALGSMKVIGVMPRDVTALHTQLEPTPYQANRVLAVLSKAMNVAEAWEIRPKHSNPCRHVEKYEEKERVRFLSSQELAAIGQSLTESEASPQANPYAIAAIRILIFTGARLNEILTAKWEYVDFDHKVLRLPDSKTGEKILQLPTPALEVLSTLHRIEGNPFLVVGQQAGQHLVNLQKLWRQIREQAAVRLWMNDGDTGVATLVSNLSQKYQRLPTKVECVKAAKIANIRLPVSLSNLRLHDLRHGFASVGVSSGMSLPIIGALLGHSQPATTARYAHLFVDPKQDAANAIAGQIKAAMAGNKGGLKALRRR